MDAVWTDEGIEIAVHHGSPGRVADPAELQVERQGIHTELHAGRILAAQGLARGPIAIVGGALDVEQEGVRIDPQEGEPFLLLVVGLALAQRADSIRLEWQTRLEPLDEIRDLAVDGDRALPVRRGADQFPVCLIG